MHMYIHISAYIFIRVGFAKGERIFLCAAYKNNDSVQQSEN